MTALRGQGGAYQDLTELSCLTHQWVEARALWQSNGKTKDPLAAPIKGPLQNSQ